MPFFEHKGYKIHYVDVDKRPDKSAGMPLVLVHGAGSSHLCWALTIRHFAASHRMIAIDLAGHGNSEVPEDAPSIDCTYVSEVKGLVDHLGIDDFVLVGHSMGGAVAMSYVLQNKGSAPRGLVLVDTAPKLDLTKILVGLAKESLDDQIKMPQLRDNPGAVVIKQHEVQVMAFRPQIMRRDLAACSSFDITDRLSEITIPTFVLVGEDDDVITPRMAKALTERLPRADLAVIRKADHVPMLEAPDEFNRLLKKYLDWLQTSKKQL